MRVIHAVRELNQQRTDPIRLIALFTEPERDAMFVRHADEAVCIGPSTVIGSDGARLAGYLDYAALERALLAARADAVWTGWGFVSERPDFAELCERLGLVFVGPDPEVTRVVGDKIGAKHLAEAAGVPVAPWSGGPVESVDDALGHAERIGFPLMIKAAAGGGGRGIRRVDRLEDVSSAFAAAQTEALQAFGDGTLLIEKLISPARHIEVQIIADGDGHVWALGVRDCSCQRRNQKVVEESASPVLSAAQEEEIKQAARRLALRSGYRNAGTVEFLYEPDTQQFSFMEVNARLQVEHPVTEAVTGVDLVKLQLHVAAGGALDGDPPPATGHAIEARLNAEDPALGFAPAPGRLAMLRFPTGPGIRVDAGVAEGDLIPPEFDSMIGKLIAWGRNRDEALARLHRAVAETSVVVEGGTTNQGFLLELIDRAEMRAGEVDTGWLDRTYLGGSAAPQRHADIALLQAAVEFAEQDIAADRARFYAFARRGRPQAGAELTHAYELRLASGSYKLTVSQLAPERYRVTVDGEQIDVTLHRVGAHESRLEANGDSRRTLTSRQGHDLLVEVEGVPHRVSRDDGGIVRNLAPAVVVSIPVAVGDLVDAGDVVAVVEAMKMESSLTAPFRGRVKEIMCGENIHVAAQEPLIKLEPIGEPAPVASSARVTFSPTPSDESGDDERERCHANLRLLRWLLLGYDIEPEEARSAIADLHDGCSDVLGRDPDLLAAEHRLLRVFADLRALSRPQLGEDDAEMLQSPQEHFHAWLRSLDTEAEGLPDRFVDQLRLALAHYGIETLERTPTLEDACYRLFLSEHRSDTARTAITAVLDRRLEEAERLVGCVREDFRDALDRLVTVMEGRDQVVGDLAREVRFRYYDRAVIETARNRVYAEMTRKIELLVAGRRSQGERLIDAIVRCPRALATLLTGEMLVASPTARRRLVEAMVRRYYRVRELSGFERLQLEGETFVLGEYSFEGRRRRLAAAHVNLEHVADAVRVFAKWAAALPSDELAVLDLYAENPDPERSAAEIATDLQIALADIEIPPALHRVVIAATEPQRGRGMGAVDLFTFRPAEDAPRLLEDLLLRGLHPMMGHRLQLWRLRGFELTRLPSAEDIYAFRGVGRENPKDERLFALAEVRDLTPVRDDDGRVVALPEFEQMLVQVLETIRGFQASRPLRKRPLWNRVLLHVWPVIELDPEEIKTLVARLAPATAGLGLEMVSVQGRLREPDGSVRERMLRLFATGHDVALEIDDPPTHQLLPLDEGARRVIAARRRGTLHPAEIVRLVAPARPSEGQPAGEFTELDLDDTGRLAPVGRPAATNKSGIVVGTIRNYTGRYPEGIERVILLGDPTRALGSLAEPECRRIMAAIDLAERLGLPLEWFALSAGAKIAMDSGTETMDWIAAVLRRIVEFTQAGGEINVVITGINVGAQPYWNAEATMLMHTRGALIMVPESAMVLTGKQALDYSGGVSADDNFGIGGYERIMGPNGEAQYWAADLPGACRLLMAYYERTYVAPGERFPRAAPTGDPVDRDIGASIHTAPGSTLTHVRDVFSDASNPGRKQPFDIRSVMRAVIDSDHPPLERWGRMHAAEIAVVWDAHLGGQPVAMIGIESRPLPRHGSIPADGPEQWTSGTLFPRSSKKIARAINAAAGRRPLVVLANLAGFDGSPESMREWQLEFGAEIGRAVVNYDGPIVFCVISRYHGGAFVVFSQKLNPQLEAIAVEGARASVIGGAPAAAVVFAREVERAAAEDPRIVEIDARIEDSDGVERQRLREQRAVLWTDVLAQKRREFADRFDAVHSVERAVEVGSVQEIVQSTALRPYLIDAVQRGMRRVENHEQIDGDVRPSVAQPASH